MNKGVVIFRADASRVIGGGHITRCLTLANFFAANNWECIFFFEKDTLETVTLLKQKQFLLYELASTEKDESEFIKKKFPKGCNLFVVDHYQKDISYENQFRGWAACLLVIDDLADRVHYCDFLVDQTPGRDANEYKGLVPESCSLLTGSEYALLRSKFSSLRQAALEKNTQKREVKKIFISFGLIDKNNYASIALNALKLAKYKNEVDIAIGSNAPHLSMIKALINNFKFNVNLHIDLNDPEAIMKDADMAIGAAGISALERCCIGLPSVVFVTVPNQESNGIYLQKQKSALIIEEGLSKSIASIVEIFKGLIENKTDRALISLNASKVCDGKGVLRIVLAVLPPEVTKYGDEVRLRLGKYEDAELMYRWQSDTKIRKWFRNSETPSLDEHLKWVDASLNSHNRHLHVIEYIGKPAGIIRLDRIKDTTDFEVSILIDPDLQKIGIGCAALFFIQNVYSDRGLIAEVKNENIASQKMFRKSGFEEKETGIFYWKKR